MIDYYQLGNSRLLACFESYQLSIDDSLYFWHVNLNRRQIEFHLMGVFV